MVKISVFRMADIRSIILNIYFFFFVEFVWYLKNRLPNDAAAETFEGNVERFRNMETSRRNTLTRIIYNPPIICSPLLPFLLPLIFLINIYLHLIVTIFVILTDTRHTHAWMNHFITQGRFEDNDYLSIYL